MDDTITISPRSTYDDCVRAIDAARDEVLADLAYEGQELSEDEVWCDLAASYLVDASRPVAEEVCRVQLGFVPGQLLQHWERQDRIRATYEANRRKEKAAEKVAARERRAADALEAERRRVKDATCPKCFTVRAPSGACNC